MTVNSPLPTSDVQFDYKSELAAITAEIEQIGKQWLTDQPPLTKPCLPFFQPTMPTPSSELSLLNAQQHLEDFSS